MSQITISVITFIIIFGILVAVHEYGHLFFAKRSGILVREYAIGMGPKILSHRGKDGTLYTIRILPLGGYVRMAGWGDDETEIKKGQLAFLQKNSDTDEVIKIDLTSNSVVQTGVPMNVTDFDFTDALTITGLINGEEVKYSVNRQATVVEEDGTELRIAPREVQYQSASVKGRLITNFGGPLNNFILGFVAFLIFVFMTGGVPSNSNQVGSVQSGSPAALAGVKANDQISSINGEETKTWNDISADIKKSKNQELSVLIKNSSGQKVVQIRPKIENGTPILGITQLMRTGLLEKIAGGFEMTGNAATTIFQALVNLVAQPSLNKLGGPVAIFQVSGQAAQQGFSTIIYLLAMLSINLGIVNLIPIPVLDGGKILFNLIEIIRRKPMSRKTEGIATAISVGFMVVLFIAVTWNDIMRLLGR